MAKESVAMKNRLQYVSDLNLREEDIQLLQENGLEEISQLRKISYAKLFVILKYNYARTLRAAKQLAKHRIALARSKDRLFFEMENKLSDHVVEALIKNDIYTKSMLCSTPIIDLRRKGLSVEEIEEILDWLYLKREIWSD